MDIKYKVTIVFRDLERIRVEFEFEGSTEERNGWLVFHHRIGSIGNRRGKWTKKFKIDEIFSYMLEDQSITED